MKLKTTLLTSLLAVSAFAQNELSFAAGSVSFLGDLGGNKGIGRTFIKDLQPKLSRPAFAVGFAKRFANYSVGIQYLHGSFFGDDRSTTNNGTGETFRIDRGLCFTSSLDELAIIGKRLFGEGNFTFTISGGIGMLYFKPDVRFIEKKYSLVQPLVMYGASVRRFMSETVSLEFSLQSRKLFTDYIDDVSLRGDPKENDSYVTGLFSLVFTGLFRKDLYGCPVFK